MNELRDWIEESNPLGSSPEKELVNRKGKPRVMGRPNPPFHNKELAPQPPIP
jgi:hypothetical protein